MNAAVRSFLFVPGDRPERFPKAWNAGAGAIRLDGELVDRPVVQRAEAILERAQRQQGGEGGR